MKVLITGSRTFGAAEFLFDVLDRAHAASPITFMSLGDAKGADSIAEAWARTNDVDHFVHVAYWNDYGKRAGYLRNQAMLDTLITKVAASNDSLQEDTYALAFTDKPLASSRGTKMMCDLVLAQTQWPVTLYRPHSEQICYHLR